MRRTLFLFLFLLLFFFPHKPQTNISFLAMGDGPYLPWEFDLIHRDLNHLPADAEFAVHLGDIFGSGSQCSENQYKEVDRLFRHSSIPILMIPGGNEINECPDPVSGGNLWRKYFLSYERNWKLPFSIQRQDIRSENFSFLINRILFIGINMINAPIRNIGEWETRQRDNLQWIQGNVRQFGAQVDKIVVFAHVFPGTGRSGEFYQTCGTVGQNIEHQKAYAYFSNEFVNLAKTFQKPVLYLHGSEHCWHKDRPFKHAQNIHRIIVDRVGKTPMLKITLSNSDSPEFYALDHRLKDKIKFFKISADQGDAYAQYLLGKAYIESNEDNLKGLKWLKQAAERGFSPALLYLGKIYYAGKKNSSNFKTAYDLLTKAAESDWKPGSYQPNLIQTYSEHRLSGIQRELELTKRESLHYLALLLISSESTRQDVDQAIELFEKSSKRGHGGSSFYLGVIYFNGTIKPKDYKKAMAWFSRALSQGVARAYNLIGKMHLEGWGTPKNPAKAFYFFKEGAVRNDPLAQKNLALCYSHGLGTDRDLSKARLWLDQAARLKRLQAAKKISSDF